MENLNIAAWSVISEEKFKAMQFDSGVLVKNFDVTDPEPPGADDIICSTSNNITVNCIPTIVDLGEDVNNLHVKIADLQYISKWDCKIQFTALEMTAETLKLALAAADHTASTGKVKPRMGLTASDFEDVWWIGALIGGGYAAVNLKNAINTAGLSITTQKDGKGNLAITLDGFATFATQDEVPMEFYSLGNEDATLASLSIGSVTLSPTFDKDVTTYTASTSSSANTITATATDSQNATVIIKNGSTTVTSGSSATWVSGTNNVTVTVTNGTASKVYTVTVTKT